ncbi:MAG: hypothetical protein EP305_05565 [Bacteroidetes bacterium]|nr:MAG: hypothetical protein EP305_05565 [Bacteroidota bacterium]
MSTFFAKYYTGRISLFISLLTSGYWILGNCYNVYENAIFGAVYELLWLFMLPLFLFVPIASLIPVILYPIKNNYLYLISMFLNLGTLIWLFVK